MAGVNRFSVSNDKIQVQVETTAKEPPVHRLVEIQSVINDAFKDGQTSIPVKAQYKKHTNMGIIGPSGPAVQLDITIFYIKWDRLEELIVPPILDVITSNFPQFQVLKPNVTFDPDERPEYPLIPDSLPPGRKPFIQWLVNNLGQEGLATANPHVVKTLSAPEEVTLDTEVITVKTLEEVTVTLEGRD